MIILSLLFFITAILYSSVGFGGGSTYLALLLIWKIPYNVLPIIALFANVIVVSGNCYNYIKNGNYNFTILTPYLVGSIPLAFIGGTLILDKNLFENLLFIILSIAGILLLINFKDYDSKKYTYKKIHPILSFLIGGILGFISGIVGIGGGIFLSPILFLLKADKPKNIITAASIFILINSIFGILGQLTKDSIIFEISNYWPLLILVLIGGQIGNFLNIKILPTQILAFITALLVLFVAIRMGIKIFI